jgi:hypothetical protein
MITREQAEAAFHKRYDQADVLWKPEVRNLQMEEVNIRTIDYVGNDEDWDTGPIELEDNAWKCTFEIRYQHLILGKWTGDYYGWRHEICYIVEPKPGAYVID